MFGPDIHGGLTEVEVGTDSGRCCDAGSLQNILYHQHGKFMGSHAVCLQVICRIDALLFISKMLGVDHSLPLSTPTFIIERKKQNEKDPCTPACPRNGSGSCCR